MKYICKILFRYFIYFSFYQHSIYPAFIKKECIRFSSYNPKNLFACTVTNLISWMHVGESEIFCGRKRERERKRLTIRRTRETSSNPGNSGDVNARQSVTRGVALLRFVYFSRKALRQHVAAAACEWHVCIQTALRFLVSHFRSSLRRRSLIHSGWSPATRVYTQEKKKARHLTATMVR